MFSEHSKECSLVQLAISNDFVLPLLSQENYKFVQTNCYCVCFQNPRCYSTQWSLSVLELQFTSTFLPYLQNVNLWLACFSIFRLCIRCEFIAMNFSCICTFVSSLLYFHIHVKRLSTEKDCVIFLWRQKVAWALFYIKMADIYIEIGSNF